ncbi:ClbS/DfsB family four-helix bundle protein [Marinomonas gallaica]|uniref:ClbS/DfsB family four-helix bundle protein n=1 Tax=Marinomonas gallaica TaxID=1806667 RepID=UPI003CE488F1
MSSIPKNKDELLSAITAASSKLLEDYIAIPEDMSRVVGIEGNVKGTEISVCDTAAYLIGWGRLVLKWHSRMSSGQQVDFPETGYKWNQLGPLAQHFQEEYKDWSFISLQKALQQVTQEILALVQSLDNYDLYETLWYENYTLGRMIQFNTSSPMKNVRTKVRRFKKANRIKG